MAVIGDTLLLAYSEADEMTITGSSTASSMPISYLLKPQPSDVARFTASLSPIIVIDRGADRVATGIKMRALYAHKILQQSLPQYGVEDGESNMRFRVRTASTEGDLIAAPTYDSGDLDLFTTNARPSYMEGWPAGSYHNWFFAFPDGDGLAARWLRIDFDMVGDGSGAYVDVSRLLVIADDTFIQPETAPTYPLTGSRVESVQIEETPGGVRVPSPSYGRRKRGGSWGWLTADEAEQAESFIAARGLSRDVLVWPFPTEATGQLNRLYSCYGLLSAWSGPKMNSYPETALDFEVEELR